eukprot:Gregarina_sp_Poly_1__10733@NODE_816_length_6185_cov_82_339980_g131_i1_p4_GENE_NODE_816_length_6185_cov_82_339980_g131_i1NODE_816_length_6185_cov_82_339980_g131_i1_p4_ORF_typecomplete_len140_score19_54_NODE_816_length_6185_cov_82_339980_g131_i183502
MPGTDIYCFRDLFQFLSAIETNRPSYVLVLAAQDAPSFARWNRDLWDFRSSCAWLHGSPLNMEDLKNAGALLAQSIIILSSRHAFSVDEEERTCQLTTVDNQTILVRQQIFALFARLVFLAETASADCPVGRKIMPWLL